jgi:hypothetical protein
VFLLDSCAHVPRKLTLILQVQQESLFLLLRDRNAEFSRRRAAAGHSGSVPFSFVPLSSAGEDVFAAACRLAIRLMSYCGASIL